MIETIRIGMMTGGDQTAAEEYFDVLRRFEEQGYIKIIEMSEEKARVRIADQRVMLVLFGEDGYAN